MCSSSCPGVSAACAQPSLPAKGPHCPDFRSEKESEAEKPLSNMGTRGVSRFSGCPFSFQSQKSQTRGFGRLTRSQVSRGDEGLFPSFHIPQRGVMPTLLGVWAVQQEPRASCAGWKGVVQDVEHQVGCTRVLRVAWEGGRACLGETSCSQNSSWRSSNPRKRSHPVPKVTSRTGYGVRSATELSRAGGLWADMS